VNAGRIGGGEGINMRAREAWFELDLRADDPRTLAALARDVDAIVARIDEPLRVERTVLGDRPAGRLDPSHPLVRAAGDALREAGIEVRPVATSTDANAAHARGIPAIAIGVTTGSGEHTPHEWIDTAPIANGVRTLARTVARFEELSA
jgi:acetylornithine deacetylase/succinyl-diaminopimelate desuccinylase-like protein